MSWIYSLSKCDFVEALLLKAVMVSNDMKPNLVTYNALIGCLCRLSRSVKGESLMREMVEFGVNPNIATCKALINGFCKERNLDKAESLLGSIVEEFEIYDVGSDFESAALILGRDENSMEFNLSVRTDGKGKFKAIKLSSSTGRVF
ncbi:pentatricopeptide repeat-containing protein At5g40400-like [Camellia sinensis]|nr:pentatricopeptide repeat-containing protein At5g40400-like [Camellia sinensis]